ncbi:MAG: hypothetical protein M8467_13160 [Anaerolineae bacterium]|nr:hypothetical protein [Anaerolineae bacterium]
MLNRRPMNPFTKLRLSTARSRLAPAVLVLIMLLLVGCGAEPSTVAPTATVNLPVPTARASVPTPATGSPLPTPKPSEPAPTPGNPFTTLLGAVTAPPGWTVEPCEGEGPFLCVSTGEILPATVELFHYPLTQHQDAPQWMAEAGLETGQPRDPEDPEQARAAREVLRALMADHMGVVEEDRGITYPEGRSFVLLEPEEVMLGRLPGLFYGFAGVEGNGETYERWLTYAALDGETFYFLTAFYDPGDTPGSFPSDQALLTFAPYLRDIVAGLKLP